MSIFNKDKTKMYPNENYGREYQLKKFLFIITILILIIGASGCLNSNSKNETRHYQVGDLSFDYPDSWNITSSDNSTVSFFEGSYNVTVIEQKKPRGYSLKKSLELNFSDKGDNFKLMSKNNLTINGIKAFESNYSVNDENGQQQRREIWLEKNNKIYAIIHTGSINGLQSNNEDFLNLNLINSKKSFDAMVNSIKIKDNGTVSTQSGHWGEISIPSINAQWRINSKSVNIANSVYHLPNSYFPGEKGEMALMGHHTQYSAPFLYIDKLKPGDKVIINDFLTQKKYTYEVESNGDVRWGVKAKNIKYKASNEPKLLLITCYPPGFMSAAWIVHTKLVSVEALN